MIYVPFDEVKGQYKKLPIRKLKDPPYQVFLRCNFTTPTKIQSFQRVNSKKWNKIKKIHIHSQALCAYLNGEV